MSQERVKEILSHVDMSKINLSSFRLSEKKFDELSHLYRNRVILSCVSIVVNKNKYTLDEVKQAFDLIQRVAQNPNLYTYSYIYAQERQDVDRAINSITTHRDRNINDVKVKAIEKRIKETYKAMRETIEWALENGNTFEEEFDDVIVKRCLQVTKNAFFDGDQKAVTSVENPVLLESEETPTDIAKCTEVNISNSDNEHCEQKPQKIGFWKRIFSRA